MLSVTKIALFFKAEWARIVERSRARAAEGMVCKTIYVGSTPTAIS